MNCKDVEALLYDRVLGLADSAQTDEIDRHAAACETCRRALERARRAVAVLGEWEVRRPARPRRVLRWWLGLGAAACAALLLLLPSGPSSGAPPGVVVLSGAITVEGDRVIATEAGAVRLADQTVVELARDTELKVAVTAETRRVEMAAGSAVFQVARTPAPFVVATPVGDVRALGTKFRVSIERRPEEARLRVIVYDGEVEVANSRGRIQGGPAEAIQAVAEEEPTKLPPGVLQRLGTVKDTAVRALAVSADGRWIAIAGTRPADRVRIRDAATGQERKRIDHGGIVRSLAFSPDGRWLATGGEDGAIRIWDPSAGREERELLGHPGSLRAVAFSPDGRQLASVDDRIPEIWIWDVSGGKVVRKLQGPRAGSYGVAYLPDGERLVSADGDGRVRVWRLADGTSEARQKMHLGRVTAVAVSPDGRRIAAGGEDRSVEIWDVTGKLWRLPGRHEGAVSAVAFSPRGGFVASADREGNVYVWEEAGKPIGRIRTREGEIRGLAFLPDGASLAAGGSRGGPRRWSIPDLVESRWEGWGHDGPPHAITFSPDGRLAASAEQGGAILLWDVHQGVELARIESADARSLSFSPDGKFLAWATGGGVRTWEPARRSEGRNFRTEGAVRAIALSPDGRWLAAGGTGPVKVWNLTDGTERTLALPAAAQWDPRIKALAFAPDSGRLAGGTVEGVSVWDLESGRIVEQYSGVGGSGPIPTELAVASRWIMAGCPQGPVVVWDRGTGSEILRGERERGAAVAPGGSLLATVRPDGVLILREIESGRIVKRLQVPGAGVRALAWSPSGDRLASSMDDTTILLWEMELVRSLARADPP